MNYKTKLHQIKAMAFDVDGVFTTGIVQLLPNQDPIRSFHSRDGYAVQAAVRQGYLIAAITGGKSETVKASLKALGIQDVWLAARHKIEAYEEWLARYDLATRRFSIWATTFLTPKYFCAPDFHAVPMMQPLRFAP